MKPDWDKLMLAYAGSKTALVADVDCTAEGEPLCEEFAIQGFPTIKYGDPNDMKDYEGARDFDSLKEFADDNLKPMCSPFNIHLCDDEKKVEIQKFQAMIADGTLQKMIVEKEGELEEANQKFENAVEALEAEYERLMEAHAAKNEEIKKSGLGMMKSVLAASKKDDAKDEL